MIDQNLSASEIRRILNLSPHPEGGWYRETFRDEPAREGRRGRATAILFLLAAGEESAVHRVDAVEIWLWHGGASLALKIGETECMLGPDIQRNETLQAVVPVDEWQSARSLGSWTLVSCVVAPAFTFAGFELADVGKTQT